MKTKIFTAIMAILLLVCFCSAALADGVWKKEVIHFDNQTADTYSLNIPGANCVVTVFNDGAISINAYDHNWYGKYVSQWVKIDPIKKTMQQNKTMVRKGSNMIEDGQLAYDVFYVKFKSYAQELPPEVKAKFDGFWGIK